VEVGTVRQAGDWRQHRQAQELEAYNIQLEKVFQADHCFNVDRIMPSRHDQHAHREEGQEGPQAALAKLIE
jgi:hypothetical protein